MAGAFLRDLLLVNTADGQRIGGLPGRAIGVLATAFPPRLVKARPAAILATLRSTRGCILVLVNLPGGLAILRLLVRCSDPVTSRSQAPRGGSVGAPLARRRKNLRFPPRRERLDGERIEGV